MFWKDSNECIGGYYSLYRVAKRSYVDGDDINELVAEYKHYHKDADRVQKTQEECFDQNFGPNLMPRIDFHTFFTL